MARSFTSRRSVRILAVAGLTVLVVAGCSNAGSPGSSSKGVTLTVNNNEGEPLTNNFNPLDPTSTLDVYGSFSMIYEPLVQYDPQRPGVTYPWLATSWSWSNGDKTLTFNLRKNVTWSDGKPFTSADVIYTFDLVKRVPATNVYGIQFANITANGKYQVIMTFAQPAYAEFYYVAEASPILPQHIWSKISKPATYTDTNPIGTGPYLLTKFTPQNFVLTKNPNYWQKGLPKIASLDYVAGTSTALQNMVNNDTLDWSSGGTPGAQKWVQQNPAVNHYWFPGGGVVSLEPNLARWPFADVAVRKAISLAINRSLVGTRGEFGYEFPVTSATGLLQSQQSSVTAQFASDKLTYDPAAAKSLLKKAGYTLGSNGVFEKGGKQLAITIEDPSGFVDYVTDCSLIETELKAVGISVTCDGVSTNAWGSDLASGNFDSSIRWSDYGNGDPYYIYNGWLNSTLAPKGGSASDDFERWSSPVSQSALNTYVSTTAPATRSQALATLEGIIVNQVPVIPLFDAADWGTFLTNNAVGWATPQDPYADDSPGGSYSEVVALHLRPVH